MRCTEAAGRGDLTIEGSLQRLGVRGVRGVPLAYLSCAPTSFTSATTLAAALIEKTAMDSLRLVAERGEERSRSSKAPAKDSISFATCTAKTRTTIFRTMHRWLVDALHKSGVCRQRGGAKRTRMRNPDGSCRNASHRPDEAAARITSCTRAAERRVQIIRNMSAAAR